MTSFVYGLASIRDLQVTHLQRTENGRVRVDEIMVGDRPVVPTRRFWKSFFSRYKITEKIFRYFEPIEVFERIAKTLPDDTMRYTLEQRGKATLALAVSNPERPIIRSTEVNDIVLAHQGESVQYADGIVTSTHQPASGEYAIEIGGEQLCHRFVMETPIDGYGQPRIYLSMLRLLCRNGLTGYSRAFRNDVGVGKDLCQILARALRSFDNDEGYSALRQRLQSAQNSWASVRECHELYRLLESFSGWKELEEVKLMSRFFQMTGHLQQLYGIANLDALSAKRQRILPTNCRVYDLMNFASEVATHHVGLNIGRKMQAFIGTLLSDEYDLEGTAETVIEFADFFLPQPNEAAPPQSIN